jgi:hypothetical protein
MVFPQSVPSGNRWSIQRHYGAAPIGLPRRKTQGEYHEEPPAQRFAGAIKAAARIIISTVTGAGSEC